MRHASLVKQIKGGRYTSFEDFDRDLRLMWENCRVYNGAVSAVSCSFLRCSLSAKRMENGLPTVETLCSPPRVEIVAASKTKPLFYFFLRSVVAWRSSVPSKNTMTRARR